VEQQDMPTMTIQLSRIISVREDTEIEVDVDQNEIDRVGARAAALEAAKKYDNECGIDWDVDMESADTIRAMEVDNVDLDEDDEDDEEIAERREQRAAHFDDAETRWVYTEDLREGDMIELSADPVVDPQATHKAFNSSPSAIVKSIETLAYQIVVHTDEGMFTFPRNYLVELVDCDDGEVEERIDRRHNTPTHTTTASASPDSIGWAGALAEPARTETLVSTTSPTKSPATSLDAMQSEMVAAMTAKLAARLDKTE
jgi:hypothetical protein